MFCSSFSLQNHSWQLQSPRSVSMSYTQLVSIKWILYNTDSHSVKMLILLIFLSVHNQLVQISTIYTVSDWHYIKYLNNQYWQWHCHWQWHYWQADINNQSDGHAHSTENDIISTRDAKTSDSEDERLFFFMTRLFR